MTVLLLSLISFLLTVIAAILVAGGKWLKDVISRMEDRLNFLHDQYLVMKTECHNNHKKEKS